MPGACIATFLRQGHARRGLGSHAHQSTRRWRRAMDRAELNDAIAQMISEVSLLHSQVGTPDLRQGPDSIDVGHPGAVG